MISGGPGPTESCRDSSENVVFTNSPNHEKTLKIDSKSIYFGGPWDTKITKSVKKWTKGNTWKNILRKTQKSRKNKPKWAPKIDRKSIKNRRLGRCLPAGLQNMDFGGPGWISRFPGVPPRAKIDKKRRKNCLTKRLKKTLCHAEFLSHIILSRSQCHTAAAEGAKLSTIRRTPLRVAGRHGF